MNMIPSENYFYEYIRLILLRMRVTIYINNTQYRRMNHPKIGKKMEIFFFLSFELYQLALRSSSSSSFPNILFPSHSLVANTRTYVLILIETYFFFELDIEYVHLLKRKRRRRRRYDR